MLVGVHFYKLEMAQRIALAQGLSRKLKDQMDQQATSDGSRITVTSKDFLKVLLMSAMLAGWSWLTWWIASQPNLKSFFGF